MKDSGIKWIGNIPDTWNVIKVKYNCSLKGRIGWQGLTTDEYIDEGPFLITGTDFNVNDGVINWDSCAHVSEWRYDQAPEIQIHNGDLLITKDGTVGKVAIVADMIDKTTLNSGVMVIRPTEDTYETKFLYYVLKSEEFWKWFNYINSGNTTISHLYQHDLNHFYFAITDKAEQRAIIDFLDKKCQQADVVINKVKEQVEILDELKKSIITERIMHGLDPFRTEGIIRLKYLADKIGDGLHGTPNYNENGEYYFINGNNLGKKEIEIKSGTSSVDKNEYDKYKKELSDRTVLLSLNGTIGNVSLYNGEPVILSKSAGYINLQNKINREYIRYYLLSNCVKPQYEFSMVGTTIKNLSLEAVRNLKIPICSLEEQNEIVDFLDKKCSVIDRIIEKKQDELNILEEQKKSLINEYITGKKRVKGYE